MSVAAGQLNVRLEKPDHYVLHADARSPSVTDLATARGLVSRAAIIAACLAVMLRRLNRA
jgi:cobalamin biosynthesis protein CobD/CbiB